MYIQGESKLSAGTENCSRITEAHRGNAQNMASLPNLVGIVIKHSRVKGIVS